MKKSCSLVAALALSLLLTTVTLAGELQTPGVATSLPTTAGSAPGDLETPGLYAPSGEVSPNMEFIYDLLAMIF
jgi:hypothetical protein